MPELPEVEVSRLGLEPCLAGKPLRALILRRTDLRQPVPVEALERLPGHTLAQIRRRGKYLLWHWPTAGGWLILHLGMSGSLRLVPPDTPPDKHDHLDLVFPETTLRFRDPRRFGLALWQAGDTPEIHPLLASLGVEPLSEAFSAAWLIQECAGKTMAIKTLLMDAHRLVGVGNIYAAESLFRAGIRPDRPAGAISAQRLTALAEAVRATLQAAIAAGGSSVRDYVHSDGGAGSFQLQCAVYARAGQPCVTCGTTIRLIRQNGRASFYCPRCQH
ncbi:MAG: bifunctional DNA-formamidopyrimidine glycosylase/DNA-(apurinic or apyrimidinic site) lyase [Zoogloeaceae bacterium]|jgi:formamidopyrimidine-DNA glycosylase|nr:bifunctional DNA-formamidopyrimidine glycosylase/DNA-(apurinic or apyrimidinic site) lyase [Zoogloeaceae bacterium]